MITFRVLPRSTGLVLLSFTLMGSACVQSNACFAQIANVKSESAVSSLDGVWQGVLSLDGDVRLVLHLGSSKAQEYAGSVTLIDRSSGLIPVGRVTVKDANISMTIDALSGVYSAVLTNKGDALEGTWRQDGKSVPLRFVRATPESLWVSERVVKKNAAMAANTEYHFEVATIKPADPNSQAKRVLFKNRQIRVTNLSIQEITAYAFNVHISQVKGIEEPLQAVRYDIQGQPEGPGEPSEGQWRQMLQQLLRERFGLQSHEGRQEHPVYILGVGSSGAKLQASVGDPEASPKMIFRGFGSLHAVNASLSDLSGILQGVVLDRPVLNETALSGKYDFNLRWTPDPSQFNGLAAMYVAQTGESDLPGITTATVEQLGLKLTAARKPVELIYVDHINSPSEN